MVEGPIGKAAPVQSQFVARRSPKVTEQQVARTGVGFVDKDVSRAQVRMDHATAMDVRDRLRQLSTPYDALAGVRLRGVVEVGLEIAVACLAGEDGAALEPEISSKPTPIRVPN